MFKYILFLGLFVIGFFIIFSYIFSLDKLTPLEGLIKCEILINFMILVHIILIVLILNQKYNQKLITKRESISRCRVGIFIQILNKYKLNKVQNFIYKLEELSNKYLFLLINVIIIIFYIFFNLYINIKLSSYLNGYIYDHIPQVKEGGI